MKKSKDFDTNIAEKISNSKLSFWKRFAIIWGGIVILWIVLIIISEVFPNIANTLESILKTWRYIFALGVVWAMGILMKKQLKTK